MLCNIIVITAKKLNMKIIIATMRYEYEEDSGLIEIKKKYGIPVYYTNRQAKLDFLAIKGIKPDLWIDDNPKWICCDAYKGYIFELIKY